MAVYDSRKWKMSALLHQKSMSTLVNLKKKYKQRASIKAQMP